MRNKNYLTFIKNYRMPKRKKNNLLSYCEERNVFNTLFVKSNFLPLLEGIWQSVFYFVLL